MKYNTASIPNVIEQGKAEEIKRSIARSSKILITTHLSPDGDALGSALALSHYLARQRKNVRIMVPNSFPYFLKWMPGADNILIYEYNKGAGQATIEKADLIFSLDYNIPKRVGEMSSFVEKSRAKKVLVDHHLDPGEIYDVVVSHPEISSTSEIIFRLLMQWGEYEKMTFEEAECIYCGMMTDTGGFTYNSNDPEIYEIISLLLRKKIDKDAIYSKVYNNFTEERFRLLGFTLSQRMKIYPELRSALIWLSKEDQSQFKFSKGDTEGFVNYPLNIRNILFSTFIREDDTLVKLSFRSQGSFPCNQFASEFFHGGGHRNASGGEFYGAFEDAVKLFEESLPAYAAQLKNSDI
ncbi:MAG: bifunctional oligoribonuclease/PAP phosphatase NrnA [Dysgonamonadaceae bacterium]|jgi:phosphoesterase RecJ-like protein|nr:bifunctional oligoribonuclease/PAP phosphatase NrnA [Dysgonamonadaceae bacterium]